MSSLAELPELIGFFSYSREDDEDSHGALSGLRSRIQGELRGQLGRTAKTFRLWQDKEAIPSGTLWETEIKNAIAQAQFFIPIITPTVVASPYCRFELDAFLAREAALGRNDLVFPILYIDVPALEDTVKRQTDSVLSLIAKRQYVDWRERRYLEAESTEVKKAVGQFCTHIRDALYRSWISPKERIAQEEAAALRRAEDDTKRQEAEARGQEEKARKGAAAVRGRERADEEWRQREAEAEQRRAEEEKRRAEKEESRQLRRSQASPLWPPSRLALAAGSVVGLVLIGVIGFWIASPPTPVAVKPMTSGPAMPSVPVATAPAPVTPKPAPVTPTPPASVTPEPTQHTANPPMSAAQERALKPRDTFQECTNCPVMTVVPAGSFTMGSPATEPGSYSDERPQHKVAIARQFAVGQFALTFDEWDACTTDGSCNSHRLDDRGWGRGRRPVIDVSWVDAKGYVAWLAQKTGKAYRLLTEAEYEYAARAGATTAYPWGGAVGTNNANCIGCGSQWDNRQTAPVGSFAPNGFGLFDMVGNVWEWTEDCYHESYNGAPADGSAWTTGECKYRVVRGGSWNGTPDCIRSANRYRCTVVNVGPTLGFRVARTLTP